LALQNPKQMTKNTAKIKEGFRTLTETPLVIISGTVVPGSVNVSEGTMSVLPNDGEPIQNVILNPITGDTNGFLLIPADGSNVVIGCVDGPGEWVLLKASSISRAMITIEDVMYLMDNRQINIQSGHSEFNISGSQFKMNASGESLYQLLKDCFTYIAALTVTTSTGTSSVPVNIADFNLLITRLDNLLTS
jgi:hypothetical protein